MSKKVMSFRTDEKQIDILHKITHGTSTSASEFIRIAIDRHLSDINKNLLDKRDASDLNEYLQSIGL